MNRKILLALVFPLAVVLSKGAQRNSARGSGLSLFQRARMM